MSFVQQGVLTKLPKVIATHLDIVGVNLDCLFRVGDGETIRLKLDVGLRRDMLAGVRVRSCDR